MAMQLEMSFTTTRKRAGKKRGPRAVQEICGFDWIKRTVAPGYADAPTESVSLIDLFCGCGGLTLGVSEALRCAGKRLDIRFGLDASEQALDVYKQNFGLSPDQAMCADITAILPGALGEAPTPREIEIQQMGKGVDIVVAGPPCQGHSNLNNVTRREDERNSLYLRVIRLAELVTPRLVLIENVPSVLQDRGGVVARSRLFLERIGYHTQSIVFNAAALGLPQSRKRHLLIALRDKPIDLKPILCQSIERPVTVADYIRDLESVHDVQSTLFNTASSMSRENAKRVQYMSERGLVDLPNAMRPSCHRDKTHSYVSMYGRLSWDKPAQTITGGFGSMGQGRFVHPSQPRVLTPHEAARLQGFPDFFHFDRVTQRTALHEMIGNAVPPKVSATVVQALLKAGMM